MITLETSKAVLVLGPDYENHRGGIGSLLEIHRSYYSTFNFIPTYKYSNNNIRKILVFVKQLVVIVAFLLKKPTVKVVHLHGSHDGSFFRKHFIILLLKLFTRKKIIFHCHSSDFDIFFERGGVIRKKVLLALLKLSDVIITVSPSWQRYFSEKLLLQGVMCLHNVIERSAQISPRKSETRVVRFLFLGRIDERKGIYDLINVFKENKLVLSGRVQLVVGGDGEIEHFKSLIRDNELGSLITFVGWVSGVQKSKLLTDSHVFILPSFREGLPISILEAMSCGLAIISTCVGGIPEVVKNNINGYIIQPGDTKAMQTAILAYVNNTKQIAMHGEQSLKIIKDYYPESVIPQLESLYTSLL